MKSYMRRMLIAVLTGITISATAQNTMKTDMAPVKELPVLFHQTAAEYRALCYQAFNTAKLQLELQLKKKKRKEKWAIVTDLDETILDNSYSEAKLIKEGKEYTSASWKQWVNLAAATEVPGASDFLRWVKEQGISIFYISNRDTSDVARTIDNLKGLRLPDADTAHTLFKSSTSSKEERRKKVMQNYQVVMLLGDNLTDFTVFFEEKDLAQRASETDKVRTSWGQKFIMLPNAIYGDWENAIYNYQRGLTPEQKEARRKSLLKEPPAVQ